MISEQEKYHNWLKSKEQPLLPYMILIGEIPTNVTASYVYFNGHNYLYSNPLKALEITFKCLTALETLPFVTDFLFMFVGICFFKLPYTKSYSGLNSFLLKLNIG